MITRDDGQPIKFTIEAETELEAVGLLWRQISPIPAVVRVPDSPGTYRQPAFVFKVVNEEPV